MNLNDYATSLGRKLGEKEWTTACDAVTLLSTRDRHSLSPALALPHATADLLRRYVGPLWSTTVAAHLRVVAAIQDDNWDKAYKEQTEMVVIFCKEVLRKVPNDNWFLPILDQLCSDLRYTARTADRLGEGTDPTTTQAISEQTSCHERAAAPIMECYRACVADNKTELDYTKRLAILNLTNHLFRIYFSINKLNLLKPLIRQIENSQQMWLYFNMADRVTYKFYIGRKAMFDSQLDEAELALTYAWRNCPADYERNRRAILTYLVPVKMFLGHMPSKQLLARHKLNEFADIADAVKTGNLRALEEALDRHERFFIGNGLFLMLEKLKIITCRTLFKKVAAIMGSNKIKLSALEAALRFMGIEDIDADETACITCNLIAQGRIKGYISHQHQMLVISKKEPFPPLSQISVKE